MPAARAQIQCLAWLALLALAGCGRTRQAVELPIYFTCDTRGRLEPCGCFTGQYGGLTRLKTVLDTEAPENAIRVDVGDAVGGSEDYEVIEYGYVLRAFAAMKFDALNAGGREARLTADQLWNLRRSSPVPILSANLLDKKTGKPIFDGYRIVRRGGCRIALVGVLDPRALREPAGDGVAVADMENALDRCLAELRGQADVILLLAFADEAALSGLARQYYECQVILGGNVSQPAQELHRENRSVIYFVTNESRALGILKIRWVPGSPVRTVDNEIRLLHDKIPQDESFRRLMQEYRGEIRRTRLAIDDPSRGSEDSVPGVRTAAAYVGNEQCLRCHKTAAGTWVHSAHARAFETLQQHDADADPRCIGCHTVGFGTRTGYRRDLGASKLAEVGCESCHGPGSLHVAQQTGDDSVHFTFRPLEAGDCRKCHYGEFSRPFDWNEFWTPIRHGKDPGANGGIATRP